MSLKLVLFDCDGTLVDSGHAIVDCMTHAFEACGHAVPRRTDILHVIGLTLDHAIAEIRPSLSKGDVADIEHHYKTIFRQQRLAGDLPEPLYPGAVDVVKQLNAAGFLLGVATGKSRRGLDAVLARHDLTDQFVTLQTADRVPAGKPAPDMVLQACGETGAEPVDVIVVGDTCYDMEMAQNAGARGVGVDWGYHPAEMLHNAGCLHVVEEFKQLPDIIVDAYQRREK